MGNKKYPRIVLAGTHSGVGKTTLACGLMMALKKLGLKVQPFKAGPDYIDSAYHSQAAGRISHNLDTWLLQKEAIRRLFTRNAGAADISIIEGVMGLYDGFKDGTAGSTAHLAKLLDSPVMLVLDARALSASAAAIVLGYKEFDRSVKISAVILNNISTESHYRNIKKIIEVKTGIPVLGYLGRDPALFMPSRHLGLVPACESGLSASFKNKLAKAINKTIDLDAVIKIARNAEKLSCGRPLKNLNPRTLITIAVAKDEAFNFYYQDNLDILKALGARLVEFSPLRDKKLPAALDGLYIGGGFPEIFAKALAKNIRLKRQVRDASESGLPVYAECGGLMYLVKNIIDFKNKSFSMAGVFNYSARMTDRLQRLGYVRGVAAGDNILARSGSKVRGHMFHWSRLCGRDRNCTFAYKLTKDGKKIFSEGLVKKNTLASYLHLHFASDISFPKGFINACKKYKNALKPGV